MIYDLISLVLLSMGAILLLLAGIGIVRMPDVYLRMSATAKAATLGSVLVLLAFAFHFRTFALGARAIATIAFLFLTSPIAAHMIGRAAYMSGTPLWRGTVQDDLRGHYDIKDHGLDSPEQIGDLSDDHAGAASRH